MSHHYFIATRRLTTSNFFLTAPPTLELERAHFFSQSLARSHRDKRRQTSYPTCFGLGPIWALLLVQVILIFFYLNNKNLTFEPGLTLEKRGFWPYFMSA